MYVCLQIVLVKSIRPHYGILPEHEILLACIVQATAKLYAYESGFHCLHLYGGQGLYTDERILSGFHEKKFEDVGKFRRCYAIPTDFRISWVNFSRIGHENHEL